MRINTMNMAMARKRECMPIGIRVIRSPFFTHIPVIILIGLLFVLGSENIQESVQDIEYFHIHPYNLYLTTSPTWLKILQNQAALIPVGLREDMSIFETNLAYEITKAYEANPWVERVHFIGKSYPNRITVLLTLRNPVAWVEFTKFYYLVDKNGIRLPGEYETIPQLELFLPVMIGAKVSPPPVGKVWEEESVIEGTSVVKIISQSDIPKKIPIEFVDISNVGGRLDPQKSEIVLKTKHNTQILWGRSPCSSKVHMDTQELMGMFNDLLGSSFMKSFPEFKGIQTIDLRFKKPIFKKWEEMNG